MALRPHTPAHLLLMQVPQRHMQVLQRRMQVPQRRMQVHRLRMRLHRLQQLHRLRATMGTALQLLVYTPPKHPRHTLPPRQGCLEPQHQEPTAPRHLLSAKLRPRTRTTTNLGVHNMHLVRAVLWAPSLDYVSLTPTQRSTRTGYWISDSLA